jgi:hypothetical protein
MRRFSPLLLAAELSFLACWHACHGWNGPTLIDVNNWHPRRVAREMTVALAMGSMAVFAPSPFVPPAFAAADAPYEEQIRQSLKPPTASRPQIVLPTSSSQNSVPVDKQPIVEGAYPMLQ